MQSSVVRRTVGQSSPGQMFLPGTGAQEQMWSQAPMTIPSYNIITEGPGSIPGYTTVKNANGVSVALVEWGRLSSSMPSVEIRNAVVKMPVGEWLKLKVSRLTGRWGYRWRPLLRLHMDNGGRTALRTDPQVHSEPAVAAVLLSGATHREGGLSFWTAGVVL